MKHPLLGKTIWFIIKLVLIFTLSNFGKMWGVSDKYL
jgi:hypothetical protein